MHLSPAASSTVQTERIYSSCLEFSHTVEPVPSARPVAGKSDLREEAAFQLDSHSHSRRGILEFVQARITDFRPTAEIIGGFRRERSGQSLIVVHMCVRNLRANSTEGPRNSPNKLFMSPPILLVPCCHANVHPVTPLSAAMSMARLPSVLLPVLVLANAQPQTNPMHTHTLTLTRPDVTMKSPRKSGRGASYFQAKAVILAVIATACPRLIYIGSYHENSRNERMPLEACRTSGGVGVPRHQLLLLWHHLALRVSFMALRRPGLRTLRFQAHGRDVVTARS